MIEIWKDIKGFEGMYKVSNLGNVKSLDRVVICKNKYSEYKRICYGKVLKNVLHPNGYLRVDLCGKLFSNHSLVLKSFVGDFSDKLEVNHINGIKTDNRLENLEWVTHSENIRHADNNGLRKMPSKEKHYCFGKKSHSVKKVVCTKTNRVFESLKEASIFTGIKYRYLSAQLIGKCNNLTTLKYHE